MNEHFFSLAATAVVALHALWILWVIAGLFIVRMAKWLRALHLFCALSTLVVMATRGYCPLTDLEVYFQQRAGSAGYEGGFIQHYASALVYGDLLPITPAGLMVLTMLIAATAILLQWRKHGLHKL